jgi:hypothetical protein
LPVDNEQRTCSSWCWDEADGDAATLAGDLGGHCVHLADLVAPVAAAHGDDAHLGQDDRATDGSGNLHDMHAGEQAADSQLVQPCLGNLLKKTHQATAATSATTLAQTAAVTCEPRTNSGMNVDVLVSADCNGAT